MPGRRRKQCGGGPGHEQQHKSGPTALKATDPAAVGQTNSGDENKPGSAAGEQHNSDPVVKDTATAVSMPGGGRRRRRKSHHKKSKGKKSKGKRSKRHRKSSGKKSRRRRRKSRKY